MKNKKEFYIISVTILHGIITYNKLGSMPYIALEHIDAVSITAFCIWAIYGAILYIVVQNWEIKEKRGSNVVKTMVLGIGVATTKGIIDFITARFTIDVHSNMMLAIIDGTITLVFGAVLMIFIDCVVMKKEIHISDKVKIELGMVATSVLLYMIMVINYFWQNGQAIKRFAADAKEIQNLDYHFAIKIMNGNVYCYTLFYIVFWFFLRKATKISTEQTEDNE